MRHQRIATFLTCGASALAAAILLACPAGTAAAARPASSITGNTIYRLAGRNDTLWMVTSNGLNYTIASCGSLAWWGYETKNVIYYNFYGAMQAPLAFGDGKAIAAYFSDDPSAAAYQLWVYDHATGLFGPLQVAWNKDRINAAVTPSLKDSIGFSLNPFDIAWTPGFFWVASHYGAVVRIRSSDAVGGAKVNASVFYPDRNAGIAVGEFPPQGLVGYPDSSRQTLGVTAWSDSAGSPLLAVMTPRRVWTFSPADTAWDTLSAVLADEAGNEDARRSIRRFVRLHADAPRRALYAAIDTTSADDTAASALYRYETATRRWRPVGSGRITAMTFSGGDTLYVVQNTVLTAMEIGDTLEKISDLTIRLGNRMVEADPDVARPFVNDVLFSSRGGDTAFLWIATNDGLYYGCAQRQHEIGDAPFTRASRAPKLAKGLRTAYFVPTILTPDAPSGYFAYNLSKRAQVTISIYDWNMDLVKTVIARETRYPGSARADGRSTVKKSDVWDGTNHEGKPVAPGVYYYKILSSEGERAMGKIIVAR